MVRIYVGGAVGRYYEPDHVLSVMRLRACPEVIAYAPRFNDAAVDRARSQSATAFLDSAADVFLQIDSDIVFSREHAVQISEQAVTHDIVGGMYVTRAKGAYSKPTSMLEYERRMEFGNDPTPVPVQYVAGGFVAIHRRVFEKLAQQPDMPMLHADDPNGRFHPFFLPTWIESEHGPVYLSEDYAVCYRAREAGFGVHINPAVRLLHLGQYAYHLEDLVTPVAPMNEWLALTRHQGGFYEKESVRASAEAPSAA